MTAYHFIVVMSHYKKGTRIAWHYSSKERLDKEYIAEFLSDVKKKCGDVHFGVYKLTTSSESWKSVVDKDKFFEDITLVTKSAEDFVELVSSGQVLSAYDIVKFILTVQPCSHLKVQKLLYYCYAEFLEATGEKLFVDDIVAYRYGPVVEEVYQKLRSYGAEEIKGDEVEQFVFSIGEKISIAPSLIKVAYSERGLDALACILKVIKEYGDLSASELVGKTHQKGSPWDRVYKEYSNAVLTDDVIRKYHLYAK